jgi:hypothetical protein
LESGVFGIIKETAIILIKDPRFHLRGKKSLVRRENQFDIILVDVAERAVERSKKTEAELFRKEKAPYTKGSTCCR